HHHSPMARNLVVRPTLRGPASSSVGGCPCPTDQPSANQGSRGRTEPAGTGRVVTGCRAIHPHPLGPGFSTAAGLKRGLRSERQGPNSWHRVDRRAPVRYTNDETKEGVTCPPQSTTNSFPGPLILTRAPFARLRRRPGSRSWTVMWL